MLEAVQISMTPQTLNVPDLIIKVKSGICLLMKVNMLVKAKIDQLVGGGREEGILANMKNAIILEIETYS